MVAKRIGLLGLLCVALACQTKPPEEVVATVNGEGITKREYEAIVARDLARARGGNTQGMPPYVEERFREAVFHRLIDDKIITQKAKILGLTVTANELDAKYDEYKKRFESEQAFVDHLQRSNTTADIIKDDLRRDLTRERVIDKLMGDVSVTLDDAAKYYEENKGAYAIGDTVQISRIAVRMNKENPDPAGRKALFAKAKEIHAKLVRGADFDAMIKESSQGYYTIHGGNMDWIAPGQLLPEVDEVAFKMKVGELSDVFETSAGYDIVKLHDKKLGRQRTFDEVREGIVRILSARKRNEARRNVLDKLEGEAKIDRMIHFNTTNPERERPDLVIGGEDGQPGSPPGI